MPRPPETHQGSTRPPVSATENQQHGAGRRQQSPHGELNCLTTHEAHDRVQGSEGGAAASRTPPACSSFKRLLHLPVRALKGYKTDPHSSHHACREDPSQPMHSTLPGEVRGNQQPCHDRGDSQPSFRPRPGRQSKEEASQGLSIPLTSCDSQDDLAAAQNQVDGVGEIGVSQRRVVQAGSGSPPGRLLPGWPSAGQRFAAART